MEAQIKVYRSVTGLENDMYNHPEYKVVIDGKCSVYPAWASAFAYACGYKAALHDNGYSKVLVTKVNF